VCVCLCVCYVVYVSAYSIGCSICLCLQYHFVGWLLPGIRGCMHMSCITHTYVYTNANSFSAYTHTHTCTTYKKDGITTLQPVQTHRTIHPFITFRSVPRQETFLSLVLWLCHRVSLRLCVCVFSWYHAEFLCKIRLCHVSSLGKSG